ncbi:unnamed protein product [Candida verbasci]|uniref:Uncharacterized protein n=1 Tax=Candida verbasci TaxID=1227364 RepID=A0A9W4XBL5_9ASCO|nr:unnamed protein product [Candida verbasci]
MVSLVAKVKNVTSADSFILIPSKTNQFPVPERLLTLSNVKPIRDFESKEYVRNLLIGKEIKFTVENKVNNREFGDISSPIFSSLIEYLLENGIVKLRDALHDESEKVQILKKIENEAKNKKVGLWGKSKSYESIELTEDVILKSQKTPIRVIVDKVINGDRIVGTLVDGNHLVNSTFLLAGLKCPRTDDTTNTTVAQHAKKFVEDKLLTTKVELTTTIIGTNQNGLPLILINHPSGNNIIEKELELGYGEIVDWQSSLIGSKIMSQFRKAEQTAKALGKGIYATATAKTTTTTIKGLKPGITIDNVIIAKVVSADTLIIRLKDDSEYTVQLASLRAPKPNDTTTTSDHLKQQSLVATAKDFVRNQVIGKSGSIYIDGFRSENKDLNLEARFLISFKYGKDEDLSELIVKNGFATVIKHNKATTNERSMNWDKLIELEEVAKSQKKGQYGDLNKLQINGRVIDASENLTKSKTFFNGFKQKGRISGFHVEYIPNGTRLKLYNPKEGTKLTLILGGLSNAKSDQLEDAVSYLNKKYLQKNIEFEIYDMDKLGGFIGNVFINSNSLSPIQINLVELGHVRLHEFAVNSNPFVNELIKAEDAAKEQHKGIWKDYNEEEIKQQNNENKLNELNLGQESQKPKFFDIEVVEINEFGVISFHNLDSKIQESFRTFKTQFQQFHSQPPSASSKSDSPFNLTKPPKKNELVSAKFKEDGKYYRAKVLNYDKSTQKFEIKHVDFGNIDKVSLRELRSLPEKFNTVKIAPFAHTTILQSLKLPPSKPTDYLTDAIYALEDLLYDKKLVINALPSSKEGIEYESIIYDSDKSVKDPDYTINKQLVQDGWAIVDEKVNNSYTNELKTLQSKAKSSHLGCWEFGDISFEDESLLR